MPLNLVLGLHMLLAKPKPGIALFKTSLIILHETAGTPQRTSSPQPLPYKAGVEKIHQEIFINFLESEEEVGVVWMLPGSVALHLNSSLPSLQCMSALA